MPVFICGVGRVSWLRIFSIYTFSCQESRDSVMAGYQAFEEDLRLKASEIEGQKAVRQSHTEPSVCKTTCVDIDKSKCMEMFQHDTEVFNTASFRPVRMRDPRSGKMLVVQLTMIYDQGDGVMISYNVTDDVLEKALAITPGKKSPNVTTLADGAKAISCLIHKNEVVKKMDELEEVGATDILTFTLSNSRM